MSAPARFAPLLLLAAGCGRPADPPAADTGASEAVRGFCEAIVRRDWPAAYALLQPAAARALSAAEFARRAEAYRNQLGFEPARVAVRTCEERGDDATARVVLSGPGGGRHSYEDNVFLRRQDGRWGVTPPARFGRK